MILALSSLVFLIFTTGLRICLEFNGSSQKQPAVSALCQWPVQLRVLALFGTQVTIEGPVTPYALRLTDIIHWTILQDSQTQ